MRKNLFLLAQRVGRHKVGRNNGEEPPSRGWVMCLAHLFRITQGRAIGMDRECDQPIIFERLAAKDFGTCSMASWLQEGYTNHTVSSSLQLIGASYVRRKKKKKKEKRKKPLYHKVLCKQASHHLPHSNRSQSRYQQKTAPLLPAPETLSKPSRFARHQHRN